MSKKAALLLLATTAVLTGINHLTKSQTEAPQDFLTPKLTASNSTKTENITTKIETQNSDPCEQLNFVSDTVFNSILCTYENTENTTENPSKKSHLILEELQKSKGGMLTPNQAVKVLKHAGCYVDEKMNVFKLITHQIVYLRTENVVDILLSTGGEPQEKLRFLQKFVPFIKDPSEENKQKIVKTFYGEEAQDEAETILVNARGVDCLWGDISEKVVTFIVDDSGSMEEKFTHEGKEITRLQYVQKSLKHTISELKPYQKLQIIRFDSTARKWMKDHVLPTSDNIANAVRWIDNLRANGGTNISDSLELAFNSNENLNAIYLLSDGYPSYGIKDAKKMATFIQKLQAKKAVPINTISFMLGNNVDKKEIEQSREFMQIIAAESHGTFKQIQ